MRELYMYSEADTMALGKTLGETVPAGTVIALIGELGSGKTVLTQGLAWGLGIPERPTSPTFTIVNQHEGGRLVLNHMDLYRVNDEEELYELGIEEYFNNDSVSVVEWPDILGALLPEDAVIIRFDKRYNCCGEWRNLEVEAKGEAQQKWLEEALKGYANSGN